ncbi:MAG: hypothetical protein ABFD92_15845 [Planctomycetaceae bacterium]|nr:hypothetical protein [Planctomycetaceae bacterium]
MKSLKDKMNWAISVGVYLTDAAMTIATVAAGVAGKKASTEQVAFEPQDGPGEALAAWLETNLTPGQRSAASVCVGLGAELMFFTTRVAEAEAQGLAGESGAVAAAADADADIVSDTLKSKLNGATISTVAACQKTRADQIFQALTRSGIKDYRLAPAPWAAITSGEGTKVPRGWKTYIRVLLGPAGGLAALVASGRPLLWRRFVRGSDPVANIISAIRNLQVHATVKLGIAELSGAVVQGSEEEGLGEGLEKETALPVVVHRGGGMSDEGYACALAEAARKRTIEWLDMFRTMRPPATLKELFPRKLAIAMLLMAGAIGVYMWNLQSDLETTYASLKRQNASHKWAAKLRTNEIENERKTLETEVQAVRSFLSTRVIWSNYLADLPGRLPPNACLTNITGEYELQMSKGKNPRKANQSLTLRGMARFPDRGSAPKEIDQFLESLREVAILKRDFPRLNLVEIKWRKDAASDIALFTILGLPKEKRAAVAAEKG